MTIKHSDTPEYKVACCDLRITVDCDKDYKPVRVRIQPNKEGGCIANQDGLCHVVTALLECGKITEAEEALRGIKCGACISKKAKLKNKGRDDEAKEYCDSCAAAVHKALKDVPVRLKERDEKKEEKK